MNIKPTVEFAKPLLARIKHHQSRKNEPCFVALDGKGGSGKSTLAAYVASCLPSITVIHGDEFYTGGTFNLWSSRSASENAQCCIDWKNQHSVISSLKSKGVASWHAFDWHSEHWDSEQAPYCATESTCSNAAVVLLEGVYSARSELSSLFDLRAVLNVPEEICRKQLIAREAENLRADWEQLWSDAEHHYFFRQLDYGSLNLVLT